MNITANELWLQNQGDENKAEWHDELLSKYNNSATSIRRLLRLH